MSASDEKPKGHDQRADDGHAEAVAIDMLAKHEKYRIGKYSGTPTVEILNTVMVKTQLTRSLGLFYPTDMSVRMFGLWSLMTVFFSK